MSEFQVRVFFFLVTRDRNSEQHELMCGGRRSCSSLSFYQTFKTDFLCFLVFPLRLQEAKSQFISVGSWKIDIKNRT